MSRFSILVVSCALLAACDEPKHSKEAPEKKEEAAPVHPTGGAQHGSNHPPPDEAPGTTHNAGEGVIIRLGSEVNQLPSGSPLVHSIWGFDSPLSIYAATITPTGTSTILFSHGDGVWTTQKNPAGKLDAIWGSSPTDVYAAGPGGIVHSKGDGKWTTQHTPSGFQFYAIFGSSPTDVWAVGRNGAIAHSKGDGTWVTESGISTTNDLQSVRAIGSDVYVVGNGGTILHKHAGTWSTEVSGTTKDLHDVWVHSATNIRAVGSRGLLLEGSGGGAWKMDSTLSSDNLDCIFGLAFGETYAGGYSGTLLHLTGPSQALTAEPIGIDGIWGDATAGVFLVGRRK